MKRKIRLFSVGLFLSCFLSAVFQAEAQNFQVLTQNGFITTGASTPQGQQRWCRNVFLISQAEMTAAGITNGQVLNYLRFNLQAPSTAVNGSIALWAQNSTNTTNQKSTTWTTAITGMTQVTNSGITIPNVAGQYQVTFNLTNFTYTGGSLYIAMEYSNVTGALSPATTPHWVTTAVAGMAMRASSTTTAAPPTLAATASRPDLALGFVFQNDIGVNKIYTLGKMPIQYGAPTVIQALISNTGTNPMVNIGVQAYITGANTYSASLNIPSLAAGASTVVSFPSYSPTNLATGDQIFVTTNTAGDQNPANDVLSWSMDVTQNLYSYKNPALPNSGGVGFTGGTGDFVAKFHSNPGTTAPYLLPPQINEIKVDLTTSGLTYQLGIWDATGAGGTPGTLLWTSPVLTSAPGTSFVPVPNISAAGDFFVGVKQTGTTNIGFAYQSENPIRNGTFYYTSPTGSATWTDFAPNSPFRFSIEVQVRIPVSPNCAINYLPANNTSITCFNPVLSWQSGGGAPTGFDVYFGTDSAQVAASNIAFKVSSNQAGLSYTPTGVLPNTTYYWKIVPQNPDGFATGCAVESFTTGSLSNCYCIPTYTGTACTGAITNVMLNTLSNTSTCVAPSHSIYPGTGSLTTSLEQNGSYNISVTCNDTNIVSVWIDYNQNGILEATEWNQVTTTGAANIASSASITIPASALLGNTLMRVRSRLANNPNGSGDACTAFGSGESEDYVVTIIPPIPCSGTPAPGNAIASASSVCPGTTVNFTLQFPTNGVGVTYQWNNNGGPIAGATNSTYSQVITQAEDIFCEVICGGNSGISNIASVSLSNFYDCYCASLATLTADEEIYNLTLNGASTDPAYSGANGCANTAPGAGSILNRYANFKSLGALTSVVAGNTVAFTIEENECDGAPFFAFGTGIWIDFNHNGSFADAGENVFLESTTAIGPRNVVGNISIPGTALTGLTGMRVIVAEGFAGATLTPCLQYGYGETEDYLINITQPIPCSGTPTPGNTIASASSICPNQTLNLSLQNQSALGAGITYQWYDGNGAIAGATSSTYNAVITAANSFYCIVTCTASGQSGTSSTVSVGLNNFYSCYCSSNLHSANAPCIDEVSFNTLLNNTSAAGCALPAYTAFPASTATTTLIQGASYNLTRVASAAGAWTGVWIDYDHSGTFDVSEYTNLSTVATGLLTNTVSITIPLTALTGQTGMRIRQRVVDMTAADACTQNFGSGETEDYIINISPASTTLSLTCFIQAYWDGASAMNPALFNQGQANPATDCDSILVELHTASNPLNVAYSTVAVLHTNGTASCVYPSGVANGNYYIVVKHRNAIETWSADSISISGATASYNFASAASQAYGSNQMELMVGAIGTGLFAFYSGDIVKDSGEATDLLDLNQLESEINNFSFGYYDEDLNGDGNVDILDSPSLEGNISGFIYSQHP